MIRKMISIVMVAALIVAQSSMAFAYTQDVVYGVAASGQTPTVKGTAFTAEKDFSNTPAVATLTVVLKNIADNNPATTIDWGGANLGDSWTKADQYLEVDYSANQLGWGVQIYTDNMSTGADPKYVGDPTTNTAEQPAGLIGEASTDTALPVAILVSDDLVASAALQTPQVRAGYGYFISGVNTDNDANTGDATTGADIAWFFLKDKSSTVGKDLNGNGVLDIIYDPNDPNYNGGFGSDPAYEILADFDSTGDKVATIANSDGISSGWLAQDTAGDVYMQMVSGATTPVIVYVAADFTKAQEIQKFRTSTLSVELYHQ